MTFRSPLFAPPVEKAEAQQPDNLARSLALLTAVVAVAPFAQRDWPVPESLHEPDHPAFVMGASRPAPATAGVIMRAPTFVQDHPKYDVEVDQIVNGILSGLADIPDPPIQSLSSEPVYFEDRYHVGVESSPRLLLATANPRPIGGFVDFPVIAWFDDGESHVLFTLRYEPEPTPARQTDWVVPWRLDDEQDFTAPNLLGTLLGPLPPPPFKQHDWPLPIGAIDPDFYLDGQPLQYTTLFVENVKPFLQSEWPLAMQAPERFQESTRESFQALLDAPNPMPFVQSEWLNPEQFHVHLEEQGWTASIAIDLGVPSFGQPGRGRRYVVGPPHTKFDVPPPNRKAKV